MTLGELNRALLARQGLLERLDAPLVEAVEAVGALQAQYWPAPPVALWSRVRGFAPEGFYAPVVRKPYNVHQIAAALVEALGRK